MDQFWEGNLPASQALLMAEDAETVKSVLSEITVPVRKMLTEALRWDEAKVNDVLDMTEQGARGAILGLPVVSLPAIKSISIHDYTGSDELWIDSLQSITDQQDLHASNSEPRFLTEVSELNLDDHKKVHSDGMSCSVIPFMFLPSLRVIRGVSIFASSYNNLSLDSDYKVRPSRVTEIDLQRSSLDAERLGDILRHMQALKRFRYDQGWKIYISGYAKPGSIINGLLACASCSLESLAVTGTTSYHSPDVKGSLKDFKVLKDIHLPSCIFLTYVEKGDRAALQPKDLSIEETPRLVDILPASVETVQLDGQMD